MTLLEETRAADLRRRSSGRGEWTHALLREAGLPDRTVALVSDLLTLYIGAHAILDNRRWSVYGMS